jgi:ABC-type polysaccharide/polyol phosphate export permease
MFGILWNLIHPMALVAIYTLVFAQIMPARFSGAQGVTLSFALFLASGLLPWLSFSETLLGSTGAIVGNAGYLKKLAIPEEVFIARAALVSLFGFGIYVVVLVLIGPMFGHWPRLVWLLMLPLGLLLLVLGYGLGVALSVLNVFFRDISQFLPVVLNLFFWLTPIAYVAEVLPDRAKTVLAFNPLHQFIVAFRDVYLYYKVPDPLSLAVVGGFALLGLVLGYITLHSLRGEVRDTV